MTKETPIGAWPLGGGQYRFRLWAPAVERVELELQGLRASSRVPMVRGRDGYHTAVAGSLAAGARYKYHVDGNGPFPDPASRSQPDGPHGHSALVDPSGFRWTDTSWTGLDARRLVIYELHVGTATPAGTFDALIDRLPDIQELGATAIELMPVAECPGRWNWGYDGVSIWAPSSRYGGPEALRRLVDAAHRHGLGVIMDVVYNHMGPDGNYLRCFSPEYFTSAHHTPWGDAVNFASRPVREFFIQNALHWLREYHIDGLRCDATHEIRDASKPHILSELSTRARAASQHEPILIAEDDRNDRKLILPSTRGGLGFDGVWADDLHHQLQVAINHDRDGYYRNYTGTTRALARTLARGWYFEGQRAPVSGKPRGTSPTGLPWTAFLHCLQNHDQIGNRALGERLHHQIEPDLWRAASAFLLLSPYPPLLFMGQEWAATAPFQFFTDHHLDLGKLVTVGRRREFSGFHAFRSEALRHKIPDPQSEDTFRRSKISWEERERQPHAGVLLLYRELLRLRHAAPVPTRAGFTTGTAGATALWYRRRAAGTDMMVVFNLRGKARVDLSREGLRPARGRVWELEVSTEERRFGGKPRRVRLDEGKLSLKGAGAVVLTARTRR